MKACVEETALFIPGRIRFEKTQVYDQRENTRNARRLSILLHTAHSKMIEFFHNYPNLAMLSIMAYIGKKNNFNKKGTSSGDGI